MRLTKNQKEMLKSIEFYTGVKYYCLVNGARKVNTFKKLKEKGLVDGTVVWDDYAVNIFVTGADTTDFQYEMETR